MERYICENVFVPLRSGPTHRAEMLSQVLFGEKYRVLDQVDHWLKIETEFDSFTGWIDMNHLQHCLIRNEESGHVLNRSLLCFKSDKTKMILEAGCEIYNPDPGQSCFTAGEHLYTTAKDFSSNYYTVADTSADTAMRFINSPYIWGGRIPSGIDCSGLTQLVYKIHGKKLPRNSWQQAETGEDVAFINEAEPGDLVFFDNENGKISHVGIIISRGLVIHASGRVRIDQIDHQGIYKQEIGAYSHRLRMIRRVVKSPSLLVS